MDSLYLITRRDVSTGQLVRIPGAGGPRPIIPMPKGYVLSGLAATQDGLYVLGLRDGASHLFWLPGVKGEAREIRDRQSGVKGKSESVWLDLGGRGGITKKKK